MRPKLASTIILFAASWVVVLTDPAAEKGMKNNFSKIATCGVYDPPLC